MILQNRNDLFKIELPRTFVPQDVKDRYTPYLFRMPTPVTDVIDVINWSIQSITIPNFNFAPIEQVKPGNQLQAKGTTRRWRNSMSPEMLIDRNFTITFQLLDGNINYWIMLETFFHWYSFENKKPFTLDIPLHIFDAEGLRMYSVQFHDVLFTGLNQFTLSYSEITPEFRTFECTFGFNELKIDFATQ
jgi:hypothetical protein